MKKKFYIVFSLLLIIGFLSYLSIKFFQYDNPFGSNRLTNLKDDRKPLKKFITSYEECLDYEVKGYQVGGNKSHCNTWYSNLDNINVYNECKDNGGKIQCPWIGHNYAIEDCTQKERTCYMTYYSQNITFPTSYHDCLPGDQRARYYQLETCALSIQKDLDGVYNKDVAMKWYEECLSNGGEETFGTHCNYHTFLPDESRRENMKNRCMKEKIREPSPGDVWTLLCDWAIGG